MLMHEQEEEKEEEQGEGQGPVVEKGLLGEGHPFSTLEQGQFLIVTLLLQPSLHSSLSQYS